ncbi:hypothetical protein LYNGBM3L_23190 [Moorena producens 3L]|uniref:Uncharacterized protein n=1 Tax=Moorena producens 3L TaxID=489825 RepID=F4XMZ7_9CYAN|nr:hypothetical protein LYNGBM3L_23190 [Moorena producens 3L]
MRDRLVLVKPPKSPNFAVRPKGDLLAHWKAHRGGLSEFCSPQNWGARGAESYPESATPGIGA